MAQSTEKTGIEENRTKKLFKTTHPMSREHLKNWESLRKRLVSLCSNSLLWLFIFAIC